MKKIIFLLALLFMASVSYVNAQEFVPQCELVCYGQTVTANDSRDDLSLFYCSTATPVFGYNLPAGLGHVSGCIDFPAAFMTNYVGGTLTAIEVPVAPLMNGTTNCMGDLTVFKVWIKTSLTGAIAYEQEVTPILGQFNIFTLTTPYTITAGDLVIGYTATFNLPAAGPRYPLYHETANAPYPENAFHRLGTTNATGHGTGANWINDSGKGLAIKAHITVDVTVHDLAVLSVLSKSIKGAGTQGAFSLSLFNSGTITENNYTIQLLDASDNVLATQNATTPAPAGVSTSVEINYTPMVAGNLVVKGKVILSGDANPANDVSSSATVKVYPQIPMAYCNNQMVSGNIGNAAQAGNPLSGAIGYLVADIAPFVGKQITTIEVGFVTPTDLSNCSVWIRNSLTGNDLVTKTFTPVAQWNTIVLDEPYIVTNEDTYIGFTATTSSGYAVGTTPNLPQNAANGCWIKMGTGAWSSYAASLLGQNNAIIGTIENAPAVMVTITTAASPSTGGTVSGGGQYEVGQTVTLTATPNANFAFASWSPGGSTANPLTFTATVDANYTANFISTLPGDCDPATNLSAQYISGCKALLNWSPPAKSMGAPPIKNNIEKGDRQKENLPGVFKRVQDPVQGGTTEDNFFRGPNSDLYYGNNVTQWYKGTLSNYSGTLLGSAGRNMQASEYINGTLYAVSYSGGNQFGTVNQATGAFTIIKSGFANDAVSMCYNPTNGLTYCFAWGGGSFGTVNLATGDYTHVANGPTGNSGTMFAAIDNDGVCYALRQGTNDFGTINLATGAFTKIGANLPFQPGSVQEVTVDRETNELYWAVTSSGLTDNPVYKINKTTAALTQVGSMPWQAFVFSAATLPPEPCDAISNLQLTTTGSSVTLTWTAAPGAPTGYQIDYDGNLLTTVTTTSHTHTSVPDGLHSYTVTALYSGSCIPFGINGTIIVGDMCIIKIDMQDDFGDGWDGSYIKVTSGGTTYGEATVPYDAFAATAFIVVPSGQIQFAWVNDGGSFDDECSFQIYNSANELIYEDEDMYGVTGVFFTYQNDCGGEPPIVYTYNIYRDNILIAPGVTGTTYTDAGAFDPEVPHNWSVKVVCEEGGESSAIYASLEYCDPNACPSVENLQAEYVGDNYGPCGAQLSWDAPTGKVNKLVDINDPKYNFEPNYTYNENKPDVTTNTGLFSIDPNGGYTIESPDRGPNEWLKWNGAYGNNGIGTNGVADFIVAARYTPADLTAQSINTGDMISIVRFIPYGVSTVTVTIHIYQGGTSATNPGTLMYEQPVTQSLNVGVYNEVTLTTPFVINAAQELWVAYRMITTSGWPAGIDAGPRVVGKGNLMYFSGTWSNMYDLTNNPPNAPVDANWMIEAFILPGGEPCNAISNLNITQTGPAVNLTWTAAQGNPTGYQVLYDGNVLNTVTTTTYTHNNPTPGAHVYGVKALFAGDCNPQTVLQSFTVNEDLGDCVGEIVGTATTTGYEIPVNTYYNHSYVQHIYTAAELGNNEGKEITAIAFEYIFATQNPKNPVTVYIAHTSKTAFSGTSDWVPVSEMTEVFSGSLVFNNTNAWFTIYFNEPFFYEGGNLVVAILNNHGSYSTGSSPTFRYHAGATNRTLHYRVDGTSPINPVSPPTATMVSNRSNTRFTFCPVLGTYSIYRDSELLIEEYRKTKYFDEGFDPYAAHTWDVVLVCTEGGAGFPVSVTLEPCQIPGDCEPIPSLTVEYQIDCTANLEWGGGKKSMQSTILSPEGDGVNNSMNRSSVTQVANDLSRDTRDPNAIPNYSIIRDIQTPVYVPKAPSKAILFNNGPFVTHPGQGSGGADASDTNDPYSTTYGFGAAQSTGYRVADNFTLDATSTIETIDFYTYQTNSSTTSPITGVNVRIWNGNPMSGGTIIWGNTTTNVMSANLFSGVYRVSIPFDGLTGTQRPIMKVTAGIGTSLPAGTYWVDWQIAGTLASGPWAVPVVPYGQPQTGNAIQWDGSAWQIVEDGNTFAPHEMAFVVNGSSNPLLPAAPTNFTATPMGSSMNCQLAWVNPTQTIGGSPLTSISKIVIQRNGTIIAEKTPAAPGQAMTHKDVVPVAGKYTYCVYAVNTEGDGEKTCSQQVTVGPLCELRLVLKGVLSDSWYNTSGTAAINIFVNGNALGTYTATATSTTHIVPITTGLVEFTWTTGGWSNEKSFDIYDENDNLLLAVPTGGMDGWSNGYLFLTHQSSCGGGDIYNIYRDGILIEEEYMETTYTDFLFDPYVEHTWCVAPICPNGYEPVERTCVTKEACSPPLECDDCIVGTGTSTGYQIPMNTYYRYSYVQQIYDAADFCFEAGASITAISFQYIYTCDKDLLVDLYLGNTTKTAFASTSDYVPVSQMDLVFSGIYRIFPNQSNDYWVTIEFNSPFNYTGGNIVIALNHYTGDYDCTSSNATFRYHTGTNKTLQFYQDGSTPVNPLSPSATSSSVISNRNNIMFTSCEQLEIDMAALSIVGNTQPSVLISYPYKITVKNNGIATVPEDGYIVRILTSNNIELGYTMKVPELASGQSAVVTINLTFYENMIGPLCIKGQVELAGDQVPVNNSTPLVCINVRPYSEDEIIDFPQDPWIGSASYQIPFNFYYNASLAQSVYHSDDIDIAGGYIKSISWFYNSTASVTNRPIKVWMANSMETSLTAGAIPENKFTLVYEGQATIPMGLYQFTVPLDEPFLYTGNNLIIMTERMYNSPYVSYLNAFCTGVNPANRSRHAYSDGGAQTIANLTNQLSIVPNWEMVVQRMPYGTIKGRVTECEDGAPLAGVTLTLNQYGITTVTDENGDYAFPFIPVGTDYIIMAEKYLYYDVAIGPFDMEVGDEFTYNFCMTPRDGYIVYGAVQGADGVYIEGATVKLEGYADYATTTVSEYGTFEFVGVLWAKDYKLTVTAPGWAKHESMWDIYGHTNMGTIILYDIPYPPTYVVADYYLEDYSIVTWEAPGDNPFDPIFDGAEDYTAFQKHPTSDEIPWTYYENGSTTYGFSGIQFPGSGTNFAYMAFNPNLTSPPMFDTEGIQPKTGSQFFACFATDAIQPNNHWMISPELNAGTELALNFWAKTYMPDYGLERMKIRYSTTTNDIASFTNYLAGSASTYVSVPATAWTEYEYIIPADAKYVAIQCVSDDAFIFMVDDILIDLPGKKASTYNDKPTVSIMPTLIPEAAKRATVTNPIPAVDIPAPNVSVDRKVITRGSTPVGYKLWRFIPLAGGGNPEEDQWGLLTNIPVNANEFVDYQWADLSAGTYKYAVRTCYLGGIESAPAFSNPLAKIAKTDYTINITTNSGDSPAGANVALGTYNATATVNTVSFTNIPVGTYNLKVSLEGYYDYTAQLDIQGPGVHLATLIEIIKAPFDLATEIVDECNDVLLTWDHELAGGKHLNAFSVYLNDALVVEGINGTEYLFVDLLKGDYTAGVQAVYSSGASDIVTIDFTVECEGIVDNEFGYKIYPNPATNHLIIQRENAGAATLDIYNAMGMHVATYEISTAQYEINVTPLAAGTYFLRVTEGATTSVKSFVKK